MDTEIQSELLDFFKALADANRLKIVGLLAQNDYTVEELAELLDLSASTVSHHLSKLSKSGLVSARAESYYHIYHLESRAVEDMARRMLSRENLIEVASDVDLDAYDRKVLKNYLGEDGRFKALPSQFKKFMVVLRYVVQAFEAGQRYGEREVNEILGQYHEDTAGLRRELVEQGFMAREGGGGEYWLIEKD